MSIGMIQTMRDVRRQATPCFYTGQEQRRSPMNEGRGGIGADFSPMRQKRVLETGIRAQDVA